MMRRCFYFILVIALGSAIGLTQTGQAPASEQGKMATAGTGDVQSDIESALLKEPTLSGANITVRVTDKTVELSGTVPSKEAKDTAEQIAKTHAGSLEVKSHLKLSGGNSASGKNPN
jgi:osmotically-inducible protein OsmY